MQNNSGHSFSEPSERPAALHVPYPRDKLIHELFEEQVYRTPDAVAVVYEGQSLTYAELNAEANRLARCLRTEGIGPDRLVAICVERSLEMLVGLLGILKAGGAYVPLDPRYPAERLAYMLNDAAPSVLLTQKNLIANLPNTTARVIALDNICSELTEWDQESLSARSLGLDSRHLAYVIYTSGSTGHPKGVMVEHAGVVNFLTSMQREPGISATDRLLAVTTMSFDIAALEIYLPLITGAKVILASRAAASDAQLLSAMLEELDITVMQATPATWRLLLNGGWRGRSNLKALCGGEALTTDLSAELLRRVGTLWNLYGPTETTIWSCGRQITETAVERGSVESIGRPISNTQIYILDPQQHEVPVGIAGEIYIGGAGLARGYLNRPELTAERFVSDRFSTGLHSRIYKTGDLGRWRADGCIEYLGRSDHQIKIRGYRIEPGEIEAALLTHSAVQQVVVIAREDKPDKRYLACYVVPGRMANDPSENSFSQQLIRQLRDYLKQLLPEYMMPSAWMTLRELPLTVNGKVNRLALPAPQGRSEEMGEYLAPRTELERLLVELWSHLLPVDRVGVKDDFFELGGHSLLIARLVEQLRRAGLTTHARAVYENPTLEGLARKLTGGAAQELVAPPNLIPPDCQTITPQMLPLVELEKAYIEWIAQSVPGGAANIQDIYPLAPLQEGILFHHLFNEQGGDAYVLSTLLSVSSRERLEELVAALQAVIARHDVLRTAVLWEKLPQPVQVVYRQAVLPVEEIALDRDRDPAEQAIKEWMRPERQRIDLRQAPLMRLQIAKNPHSAEWYALLQLQHLTSDHITAEAILSELGAYLEGREHTLPEPEPYRNHVAQALAWAKAHDVQKFFRAKLGDIDEPTAPFGLLDVHGDGSQIGEARECFDFDLAQRVRAQARSLRVSVATLFHAAWALVVAHTSARDDVVFGSVFSGRLQGATGFQQMLGMFINTLPLRLRLRDITARELVEQTRIELVDLLDYEQASLAVVQRCSGIVGSAPLFSTLLNYRHTPPASQTECAVARGIRVLVSQERTNYPITVSVDDSGEGFALETQSDRRIDPRRINQYLSAAVESLVQALEDAPHTPALSLSILSDSERHQVIEQFNATQAGHPQEKLIHELFEKRVERTPNAVAVVYEGRKLTYAELNQRANQLARYLIARGIGPEQLVGICLERGLEMVVSLLGILKAGGAYLPLDPSYPTERLKFMVEDAAPRALLTQSSLRASLRGIPAETIALDTHWSEILQQDGGNLDAGALGLHTRNLAYVIYTSGSTGQPKGVLVEHRNVTRLFSATEAWFQFNEKDVWTLFHSFAFDFSVWELWGALLYGGRVVIVPHLTTRSPEDFYKLVCEQEITVLNQTPSAFVQLIDAQARDAQRRHSLRIVIFGGEALELHKLQAWVERNGAEKPRLVNMYGITETTVHVTYCPLTEKEIALDPGSLIGKPIPDLRLYLLNPHRHPVPIGVPGELYVGGAGVARGYLNRPELTAERFIADPFSAAPDASLYRTGDLGRWRSDGTIEYLGRNDQQVKIRGFRIELGEIEAQLVRNTHVRDAVVLAREDIPGEKRLVAYVLPHDRSNSSVALDAEALRAHLMTVLPQYMVPSAFMVLDKFPLTANGKLDRRLLPSPSLGAYVSREYEAPQGPVEKVLADIWKGLLQVQQVGRQDNFFDLGGHSLLTIKLLFEINRALGASLSVSDVYKSPSLTELAARISGRVSTDEPVNLRQEAHLSEQIRAVSGLRYVPDRAILLTGCTGFVGRFLLAQLLEDTHAHIYCLMRSRSPQQAMFRLKAILTKWNLWRDELEQRLVAVPGDLSLPRLGISDETYRTISEVIDSIYHCATSMNHLESYAMAKRSNVDSARELLKLATWRKPKLINYISTLSVFGSAGANKARVVNEQSPIDDERHSTAHGYAASKWVAEKIFMTASKRGIPCNIFRLGLVWADTQQGRYDELQREYRILKTCLLSRSGIKNYRYDMPPTPVDYVARAVVFLAKEHPDGQGIFHISSPAQEIEGVFERCNEIAGASLELRSFFEWISEIKRLHSDGKSLPIVPLIEYAFSMDEASFSEHRRNIALGHPHFDCGRTHQELERAGIVAPVLNDDFLKVLLESMFLRDVQIREWLKGVSHGQRENDLPGIANEFCRGYFRSAR